jgi:hypothetical protein
MQRIFDRAAVMQEMAAVTAKLDSSGISREERLALLRRQAQLGDLRDAVAQRERRSAQ